MKVRQGSKDRTETACANLANLGFWDKQARERAKWSEEKGIMRFQEKGGFS